MYLQKYLSIYLLIIHSILLIEFLPLSKKRLLVYIIASSLHR
jgi:hypothetical protein